MARNKSTSPSIVTTEPVQDYSAAVGQKVSDAVSLQIQAAVADLNQAQGQRAYALDAISTQVARLIDPETFNADLFEQVAIKTRGVDYRPRSMFAGVTFEAQVEEIQQEEQLRIAARPTVSDFLALPSSSQYGGYESEQPQIEGAADDDYQD
jgi:hypothetical protein